MPGCRLRPKPPLDQLVGCLWYWQGAPGPHLRERLLPNAEASMVFNLRDDPIVEYEDDGRVYQYGQAVVSGARSNCFAIACNVQDRVIGVQFRPGGAAPFFPMPVSTLEDASFNVTDIWGKEATWIRERILAQPTPGAMLHMLSACLLERLSDSARLHPSVIYTAAQLDVCDSPGRVAVVTERVGMSQRRLTQLFHEQVGVSPKTFHCVRRFQHTLRHLRGKQSVDWADVAVQFGYYDQAHLSHDFRRLTGMTPGAYLAAATEHMNHVPLTD